MNVKLNTVKRELTITIPLCDAGHQSSSGKTYLVASSGGSQPIAIKGLDGVVKIGLNIFSKTDVLAALVADPN